MNTEVVNRINNAESIGSREKTYIDKILGKEEVEKIRTIIKKDKLTRSEILDLLYSLSSNEMKLLKMDKHERYVINKLFVWIRDFVEKLESIYDYIESVEKKQKVEDELAKKENRVSKKILSERGLKVLNNIIEQNQHMTKFLVDLYFNICRTSMSVDGHAFGQINTSKFEYLYPGQSMTQPGNESRGFFRRNKQEGGFR